MTPSFVRRLMDFNSSRYRLWQVNEAFAATIPDGAVVLDAGSGNAPYKRLFGHARYETADFGKINKEYAATDYVCDLTQIPVEDERFDFIIFNQVMEHVPEPQRVLAELSRVLKRNGRIIYTGPLFYEEHEQPYDFFRYTQFGLRHLFKGAGLTIERLDWLEGYFGTVGYQLQGMADYLPYRPSELPLGNARYGLMPILLLLKVVFAVGSILFHRLEVRAKYTARGYPKNYIVIAAKRGGLN